MLESESNKDDADDKHNQVDMLYEHEKGAIIIIEVQFYEESDYSHRILYGTSKVITEYMTIGSSYENVKKVYSINILYFDLDPGSDYIYRGRMEFKGINNNEILELGDFQKNKFGKSYPSDIFPEIILIKVNPFYKIAITSLDEWIYFLKYTSLPKEYSAKGLKKVAHQLKYDNLDTTTKQQYDQYIKGIRISNGMIEAAKLKGHLEVPLEGEKSGERKREIEVVISSFDDGLPIDQISSITKLSVVEVQNILKEHGKI